MLWREIVFLFPTTSSCESSVSFTNAGVNFTSGEGFGFVIFKRYCLYGSLYPLLKTTSCFKPHFSHPSLMIELNSNSYYFKQAIFSDNSWARACSTCEFESIIFSNSMHISLNSSCTARKQDSILFISPRLAVGPNSMLKMLEVVGTSSYCS